MIDMDKLEKLLNEEKNLTEEEKQRARAAVLNPNFEQQAERFLAANSYLTYTLATFVDLLTTGDILALMYRQIGKIECLLAEREGVTLEEYRNNAKRGIIEKAGREMGVQDYDRTQKLKNKIEAAGGYETYMKQQAEKVQKEKEEENSLPTGTFLMPGGEG